MWTYGSLLNWFVLSLRYIYVGWVGFDLRRDWDELDSTSESYGRRWGHYEYTPFYTFTFTFLCHQSCLTSFLCNECF